MVKVASIYSKYCMYIKYAPRAMVKSNEKKDLVKKLLTNEWWAHVTLTPLVSKITVLSKGIEYAESGLIPLGGHCNPISMTGTKEAS